MTFGEFASNFRCLWAHRADENCETASNIVFEYGKFKFSSELTFWDWASGPRCLRAHRVERNSQILIMSVLLSLCIFNLVASWLFWEFAPGSRCLWAHCADENSQNVSNLVLVFIQSIHKQLTFWEFSSGFYYLWAQCADGNSEKFSSISLCIVKLVASWLFVKISSDSCALWAYCARWGPSGEDCVPWRARACVLGRGARCHQRDSGTVTCPCLWSCSVTCLCLCTREEHLVTK